MPRVAEMGWATKGFWVRKTSRRRQGGSLLVAGSPRRSGAWGSATGTSVLRSTARAEGLWPGGSQLIWSSINGHLIGSSEK